MKKKPRGDRQRAKRRAMRRDPFGRLAIAVGDYLESIGWSAVVVGTPTIIGEDAGGVGRFQFLVTFTGGRTRTTEAPPT